MFPFSGKQIWFYQNPVDFRKQIDGLIILLADHLNQNPTSGQLYIFRSTKGDRLKIIYWENNGFWLLYKRLEKGRFKFPEAMGSQLEISPEQLSWLLSGLDFQKQPMMPKITASNFY